MNRYSLRGKVVLITGATGGIGAACARRLRGRGARLVLVDLNQSALDALTVDLGTDTVLAVAADVTSLEQMRSVALQAVHRFGRIDVVFANAGIAADPPVTVATADVSTYEKVLEVNLLGVWRTVKACLDEVIRNQGYILVTASTYAFVNGVVNSAYATSKAAVEMFGRSLRAELAHTGARAGVLYPGWVATPIAHAAYGGNRTATTMAKRAFKGPLGKPIEPDRIARAVTAGMERRGARIVEPRVWVPISLMRGVFATATDAWLDRDTTFAALTRRLEAETRR
ncbi:SDR family NAD(P)-dependent oxidoreductase [Nocardia sp. CNY236]|uniref:SDR family NAD(P)-dependent oxidoreductase n=1 Tax=Nocardia sp. CNY236 TaxID=1169152 RepID=UPI0003F6990C|nr:SDR family NAD(P)-dependent oxidoreductase [Nocardia sp. CNY236]